MCCARFKLRSWTKSAASEAVFERSSAAHEGPVTNFQKTYYRILLDEKSSNWVI
jgi:hypothetical protein